MSAVAADTAARDALMARLRERFERAAEAGCDVREVAIADARVRLRFAGSGLRDALMPALRHLEVAPAPALPADLTVHLWTTRDTGVPMIDAPWKLTVLEPGAVVPEAAAMGLFAIVRPDCGLFMCYDPAAGVAFVWIEDAARLDRHDRAAPLRPIFTPFFEARGSWVTHAGAVGRGGAGVLLGGRGGSGKSTTSLLCLEAGFDYASDDYVLVDAGGDGRAPFAHSLYATGKVLPEGLRRLRALGPVFDLPPVASDAQEGKAIAWLHGHTDRLSRGFRLVALLMPQVTGRPETRVVPMTGGMALRLLAPSSVFQQQGDARRVLAALSGLVSRVTCLRLELGTELARIPEVIADVIERHR